MAGRRGPWESARQAWERLQGWVSAAHADGGVPALEALDDIGEVRRALDQAELEAVRTARRHGRSWAEIATRLGVTRQSAWERWRDLDEPVAAERPAAEPPLSAVVDDVLERAAHDLTRRPSVRVPLVVGLSFGNARRALHDVGLLAVGPDPDAPPPLGGTVIDQKPEPGYPVPTGSAVMLWVDGGDGGSGVREPRRPGPDPRRAVEHVPEAVTDERTIG